MKASAQTNEPVAPTTKPTTSGVTMPARLAQRLKTPPVRPISCFGATSVISVQPRLHHALAEEREPT